eukprot:14348978-Alexandrium_andersonii.AAC.1
MRLLFSGGAQRNHQLQAAGLVDDKRCWCGAGDQTLPHLWHECQHPQIATARRAVVGQRPRQPRER